MRINKYIAHAGVASRRKAEELIKQGLVTVNGQVVRELATTIKSGDKVEVEGQPIYNEEKVYYLLNKPRGSSPVYQTIKGDQLLLICYRKSRNGFILSVVWTGILLVS